MKPMRLSRASGWLIFFVCLVLASCQPSDRKADTRRTKTITDSDTPSRSMLPFGDLNAPANKSVLPPPGQIAGWALSEDGIQEVALFVDRKYVSSAKIGLDRPDVASAYPKLDNSAKAGWEATIDVDKLTKGPHELITQGRTKKGAVSDLGKIVFFVQ